MTIETETIRRVLNEQLRVQRNSLEIVDLQAAPILEQLQELDVRRQSALAIIGGLEKALATLPPEAEPEVVMNDFEPEITDEDPYDAAFGTAVKSDPEPGATFQPAYAPYPDNTGYVAPDERVYPERASDDDEFGF